MKNQLRKKFTSRLRVLGYYYIEPKEVYGMNPIVSKWNQMK